MFPSINDTSDGLETVGCRTIAQSVDMLKVRPELVGCTLSPADDAEEDISEPWLELCEGH